jgi:nitrogen fixation/metabolism regulation signal transduction histidine kinase
MLRPVRQLVGEAERAPVASRSSGSQNEADFVLETFQSVVAKLQTQQRELERLSAQASARAASAEQFSERVIASVPSGLVAFGADGNATVLNSPAATLLNASDNGAGGVGTPFLELLSKTPELARMVGECLASGEIFRREEVEMIGGNGARKRIGATIAPIEPATAGAARGALCMLTDITEVTQLREQVALKRNLESLGEMSAGLAHEFKNALAALHGYAQLLQSIELDDRAQAASGALLDEVRNLSSMVSAFLNFARPQPLEVSPLRLDALVRECVEDLETSFTENQVAVELSLLPVEIGGDERMLRQALLNLIRNAIEAVDSDSERRLVRIVMAQGSPNHDSGEVSVEISDTGAGIPVESLNKIFLPFFTTKPRGHGIGLALTYRVITEHSGVLTAGNGPDGGAVFKVRLPSLHAV